MLTGNEVEPGGALDLQDQQVAADRLPRDHTPGRGLGRVNRRRERTTLGERLLPSRPGPRSTLLDRPHRAARARLLDLPQQAEILRRIWVQVGSGRRHRSSISTHSAASAREKPSLGSPEPRTLIHSAAVELSPGARLDGDRYRLLELIGEGGQGSVWKAEDRIGPDQLRALKLVRIPQSRATDIERMRREARALAGLNHPSLVLCHGLFEDLRFEVLGLSLDWVEGSSLRKVAADPAFTREHRIVALGHIARALGYVHERGVLHRDLKLDNVLVKNQFFTDPLDPSTVKVVDFGIAAQTGNPHPLTAKDSMIGTYAYMAPELLDLRFFGGDPSAPAIDLFAFGVLGWQLLRGQHPTGLSRMASPIDFCLAYRHYVESNAAFPGSPEDEWERLLAECLALRPADRLQSGSELAARWHAGKGAPVVVQPASMGGGALPTAVASPAAMVGRTLEHSRSVDPGAPTAVAPMARPSPTPAGAGASSPSLAGARASSPRPAVADIGAAARERGPRRSTTLAVLFSLAILGVLLGFALVQKLGPLEPAPPPSAPPVTQAPPTLPTTPPAIPIAAPSVIDAGTEAGVEAGVLPAGCDAGVCSCCPGGRDCSPGTCADPLDASAEWELHLSAIYSAGGYPLDRSANAEVCVRARKLDADWQCQVLGTDDPETAPTVRGSDIVDHGLDVKVEQGTLTKATANARFRAPLLREALCTGLLIEHFAGDLQIESVRLFLRERGDSERFPWTSCSE